MTALPSNVSYGKVRGKFGSPILSAGDADGIPDFLPLTGLEVTFTPKPDVILNLGASPDPVTFLTEKIVCTLDDNGYLVGPDGREGIFLIATDDPDLAPTGWTYEVSFGGNLATYKRLASFSISVPADSTRWLTSIAPVQSTAGGSTLNEIQAAILQVGVAVGQAQSAASTAAAAATAATTAAASAAPKVAVYLAAPTTSGDQTATVQAALGTVPSGGTLIVGDRHRIDGQINVTTPMSIKGSGRGEFYSGLTGSAAQTIIRVTSSDVDIDSLKITGPQYAIKADQSGVIFQGASGTAPLSNVSLTRSLIRNFGKNGVLANYVKDFQIDDNSVRNCCYTGIGVSSAINGSIDNNRVKNITQTGYTNSYGIYTSRNQTANMTIDPRSANISINNNKVFDVPLWDGINTHAGVNHTISANVLVNCGKPIEIVGCEDGGGTVKYAPLDISVVGNTMTASVTDGSLASGIVFVGAQDTNTLGTSPEYATGTITGNVIRGHGLQNSTITGGILAYYTKGLIVSGNTIVEGTPNGILFYHDNVGFVCSGNTIIDPWTTASGAAVAISAISDYNSGYIGENRVVRASRTATLVASRGIYIASTTNNNITLGINDMTAATTPLVDAGVKGRMGLSLGSGLLAARPTATSGLAGATYVATDVFGGTQYRVVNTAGAFAWAQTGAGVTEASGADGQWKARDNNFVATSGDPATCLIANQTAMVSGTQYITRAKVDQVAVATSVQFYVASVAAGITEASVDLFNSAGTRIATADVAAILGGTAGLKTVAFTTPTATLAAGDVLYVGIRGTFPGAGPSIRGLSAASIPNINTPSGAKVRFGRVGTGLTSPQTSITVTSILSSDVGTQCHWFGLI